MAELKRVLEFFDEGDAYSLSDFTEHFHGDLPPSRLATILFSLNWTQALECYGSSGRGARYVLSDSGKDLMSGE